MNDAFKTIFLVIGVGVVIILCVFACASGPIQLKSSDIFTSY